MVDALHISLGIMPTTSCISSIHVTLEYQSCFIYNLDIVQILVQSHFELVSSVQALEATEPVAEPVTQMAVELINNHLISCLLYTSPSPRDRTRSRMPSSA